MAPWSASKFQLVMIILKRWWHEEEEDNTWQSWYLEWSIDSDDNVHMRETIDVDHLEPTDNDLTSEYDLDTLIFEDTASPEPEHEALQ
jgi:hypothetical protein